MWGVHQIQPTLVVGFLAAAGCLLLQQRNGTAAGILLAIAMIKPQLLAVLIAWLFLWAALRRTWSFFGSFGVTMAVLLGASYWLLPNWVQSWRSAMADYTAYRHLQLELVQVFGHLLGLALALSAAVLSAFILWRNRNCSPDSPGFASMCALALGLTLLILPSEFAMVYNYILLIPAVLMLIFSTPEDYPAALARRISLGLVFWSFASVFLAVIGETLTHPASGWDSLPFQTLLLPSAVVLALAYPLLRRALAANKAGETVSVYAQ
jgi:hypothetical protein